MPSHRTHDRNAQIMTTTRRTPKQTGIAVQTQITAGRPGRSYLAKAP